MLKAQATARERSGKTERLCRVAREAGLGGIILATPPNVAWVTGGQSNRIDLTRETGAGALFVTADGHWSILASAIEMPRMAREVLPGAGAEAVEFPWADERANPGLVVSLASRLAGGRPVGTDWNVPGAVLVEDRLTRIRAPLMPDEIDRLRVLGHDAGVAIGALCRTIEPGASELEVAGRLISSLAAADARALVVLVAADARIAAFRHPLPTDLRWKHTLLLACCAERHGLVVALSRLVSAGPVAPDLAERTRHTAGVYGALLRQTVEGVTGCALYEAAADAYRHAGFPGEEERHHQGGAIGYKAREWVAHPASQEIVQLPQAFAWNPSITGTKVEETALVSHDGIELVTASPDWPSIPIEVRGQTLAIPDILVRNV